MAIAGHRIWVIGTYTEMLSVSRFGLRYKVMALPGNRVGRGARV